MDYVRTLRKSVTERGVNQQCSWLSLHIRPVEIKLTDRSIWGNFVQRNTLDGRQHWKCGYCKTSDRVDASTVDINHRFKQSRGKRSKFAACPEYSSGDQLFKTVISDARTKPTRHTYHVPATSGQEYQVHKNVFQAVFNVGIRRLRTCQQKVFAGKIDGRSGAAGRKSHDDM